MKERKTVILKVVNNRYADIPYPLAIPFDTDLGCFNTGQQDIVRITDDNKDNWAIVDANKYKGLVNKAKLINPFDPPILTDGKKFEVLADPDESPETLDDYIYNIILSQPDIYALSQSFVVKDAHTYYLFDEHHTAELSITKADLMAEAISKINENLSIEGLTNLGIFLELGSPERRSKKVLEGTIKAIASKEPKRILAYFEDKKNNLGRGMLLKELLHYNILVSKSDRSIWNERETILVGHDKTSAMTYLFDSKNEKEVAVWTSKLKEAKNKVA